MAIELALVSARGKCCHVGEDKVSHRSLLSLGSHNCLGLCQQNLQQEAIGHLVHL